MQQTRDSPFGTVDVRTGIAREARKSVASKGVNNTLLVYKFTPFGATLLVHIVHQLRAKRAKA